MYNGLPSPIVVVHGEKAREMIRKSEAPRRNYTKEVNVAREKLRKAGMFK